MCAEPGCVFFVDCEPCVNAFLAGRAAACADKKPLARVNRLLHDATEEFPRDSVVWMPSHTKKGECGQAVRGDGFLLTETDVEFNDYADRLAKAAVEAHRVPYRIRQEIEAHNVLTTDNAKWIARATVLANQQPSDPTRDTQASKAKAAEAAARKRKLKRTTAELDPPQLPGQTTSLPAIPNTNGNKPKARSAHLGGHVLERTTHGWWCTVCRV